MRIVSFGFSEMEQDESAGQGQRRPQQGNRGGYR